MNQIKFKISKYDKYTNYFLSALLFVIDYLAIVLAEQSAFVLRNWIVSDGGTLHISWLNFWVVFPLLYLLFLNIEQLYNRRMQFWQVIEKIFQASLYAVVAIVIVLYIGQIAASTSRMFIFLLWLFSFIYLTVFRYLTKKFLEKVQLLQIPVLIIGAGKTAELLVKGIINDAGMGYKIIGLLEDNCVRNGILKRFPVLGKFSDVEAVILKTGVQHVFIAAPGLEQEKLTRLIYKVQPLVKNMGIIPNLVGIPMGGIEVESLFNEKLMLLRLKNNLARSWNRYLKTIFDFALTLLGTVAISPILIFIAIWIYIDSPGPVIFKHMRIGKNGKKFPCYKFRSMCMDAEEKLKKIQHKNETEGPTFKMQEDPRITKVGHFIRKYSIDELLQLVNILKGDMSIIGPRPALPREVAQYGEFDKLRLLVKPGLSCYWQISGRSDIPFDEWMKLDVKYIREMNLLTDIKIILLTFPAVIKGDGAY